jgi:hypothetical protein
MNTNLKEIHWQKLVSAMKELMPFEHYDCEGILKKLEAEVMKDENMRKRA